MFSFQFLIKSYFRIVLSFIHPFIHSFIHSFILKNCPYHLAVLFITVFSKTVYPLCSPFLCSLLPGSYPFVCLKNLICIGFCLLISLAWSVSVFLLWRIILFGGIFITAKHVLSTHSAPNNLIACCTARPQPFCTLHAYSPT
jgi:hypothetical protein